MKQYIVRLCSRARAFLLYKWPAIKKFIVDTFAMVVFSLVIGMTVELLSGYTVTESLAIRAVGTVTNILTGGLYGAYVDWARNKTLPDDADGTKKLLVDTLAFVTFQIPLYVLVQIGGSAIYLAVEVGLVEMFRQLFHHIDWGKIFSSCLTVTIVSTFIGRPYGLFLDKVRSLFGVTDD